MQTRSEYLNFLMEWLAPLGEISARSMFGGHCLYCDGVVFALVADQALFLKVDDTTRPRFEALGLKPFRPYEDRAEVMQYYPPPAEFFEDNDAMQDWGRAAVDVGKRAQKKKSAKKRARASGRN